LELLDAYRVTLNSSLRRLDLLAAAKQAEIELDRAIGEEIFP
jgi:outer membrane protein TolC